jgi:hypothetical protein
MTGDRFDRAVTATICFGTLLAAALTCAGFYVGLVLV